MWCKVFWFHGHIGLVWPDHSATVDYLRRKYLVERPSISKIINLPPVTKIWSYSKIFLLCNYISKYCNLVSIFLQTLARIYTKMQVIFSKPKFLGILKQIFLEPMLMNISCETSFFKRLLLLWVVFMTFTLNFRPREFCIIFTQL